jgi:hypothetical protein
MIIRKARGIYYNTKTHRFTGKTNWKISIGVRRAWRKRRLLPPPPPPPSPDTIIINYSEIMQMEYKAIFVSERFSKFLTERIEASLSGGFYSFDMELTQGDNYFRYGTEERGFIFKEEDFTIERVYWIVINHLHRIKVQQGFHSGEVKVRIWNI